MNDFTKDELSTILLWINDIPDRENWPEICDRTLYYRNLAIKVQLMIDSYCEHRFMTFLQNQNNEPFIDKCMKCHELRIVNE